MKEIIGSQPPTKEGRNYEDGVTEALKMFALRGNPGAQRTIVLFANGKSPGDLEVMESIRKELIKSKARLIIVAFDDDVYDDKLKTIAPNDNDIVRVRSSDSVSITIIGVAKVIEKG